MSWPGAGCCSFARRHASTGSPPFSRPATFRNSSWTADELPQRDREKAIGADIDAVFELELLLEAFAPQAERRLRARRQVGLEVIEIRLDGRCGFGRRVGEIAKNVKVVETRKRARQIGFDEAQRAAPAFEADFHEDARALFDVVAGGLHEPRNLPKLGHDPAGPLGFRRVGEERLPCEAAADDLGVDLRVALPGSNDLQLVHPGFDAGRHDRMVHLLDPRQVRGIDLMESAAEAG